MSHRIFLKVDLEDWVYGTIDKCQQGESWRSAWIETYRAIGGVSVSSGEKHCPMMAARTLFEYGRLKNRSLSFTECRISDLWHYSRNGTYAILATRLLHTDSSMDKNTLWRRIQHAVVNEVGAIPAGSDQGGAALTFQLWHLDLIKKR